MLIEILSNEVLQLSQLVVVEEDAVIKRFSCKLPRARYVAGAHWDGIVRKYNATTRRLSRGFLKELTDLCDRSGFLYQVRDNRPPPNYGSLTEEQIPPNLLPGITLEPYQLRAIKACVNEEVGIHALPTGAGKTEVIAGICRIRRCPTLILADAVLVVHQIKERLELREVASELGVFFAGQTPEGQEILIGSVQSLDCPSAPDPPVRHEKETEEAYQGRRQKWLSQVKGHKTRLARARLLRAMAIKCEQLIVDEADRASSKTFQKVFKYWFKGRYRYGLSGTPFDDDKPVEALSLQENLGTIISSESRKTVEDLGRTVPLEYFMIVIGEEHEKFEGSAFDVAYQEKVILNPDFYKAVQAIIAAFPDDGTLILVDRDVLGQALAELIPNSKFIHGATRPKMRNVVIKEFEERQIKVLVGGKILERGLDLHGGCENLIIATSQKLRSNFEQKIGRAVRLNKLGKGRVFGFYYLNNKYLYSHSRAQLKFMVKLGYPTTVIYPDGTQISGADLIKRRFRRPR